MLQESGDPLQSAVFQSRGTSKYRANVSVLPAVVPKSSFSRDKRGEGLGSKQKATCYP